jgi:hypothetical protein
LGNFEGLIKTIQRVALAAVEQSKPSGVYFGTVTSVSPLEINREQKMTLDSAQLIIPQRLRGGLANGDSVILLRVQGGQKYVVTDRV